MRAVIEDNLLVAWPTCGKKKKSKLASRSTAELALVVILTVTKYYGPIYCLRPCNYLYISAMQVLLYLSVESVRLCPCVCVSTQKLKNYQSEIHVTW